MDRVTKRKIHTVTHYSTNIIAGQQKAKATCITSQGKELIGNEDMRRNDMNRGLFTQITHPRILPNLNGFLQVAAVAKFACTSPVISTSLLLCFRLSSLAFTSQFWILHFPFHFMHQGFTPSTSSHRSLPVLRVPEV